MRKFNFELKTDEDLIVLVATVNGSNIKMALDTAASHSVIDLNILLIMGYSSKQAIESIEVETSNGVMAVECYELKTLNILDKTVTNFTVMSYDFLEKGIASNYQGVLGLDFFTQTILTIDFINQQVWLQQAE